MKRNSMPQQRHVSWILWLQSVELFWLEAYTGNLGSDAVTLNMDKLLHITEYCENNHSSMPSRYLHLTCPIYVYIHTHMCVVILYCAHWHHIVFSDLTLQGWKQPNVWQNNPCDIHMGLLCFVLSRPSNRLSQIIVDACDFLIYLCSPVLFFRVGVK